MSMRLLTVGYGVVRVYVFSTEGEVLERIRRRQQELEWWSPAVEIGCHDIANRLRASRSLIRSDWSDDTCR